MRVLLTGASGQLGTWIVREWDDAQGNLSGWSGTTPTAASTPHLAMDLTDGDSLRRALDTHSPDLILHAAALSKPDAVRLDPGRGWSINVEATARLCDWCREHNRRLVFTSTDMVFDGRRGRYAEADPPNTVVEYGRTKAAAERLVQALPRGLVVRVCLLYGPSLNGRPTFFTDALSALQRGESRAFFADEYRTPLDYRTAAQALIRLGLTDVAGIIHLAGEERVSRFDLIGRIAEALGLDRALIRPSRLADAPSPEPRPADVSLDTGRLNAVLPDFRRPTIEEAARSWVGIDL